MSVLTGCFSTLWNWASYYICVSKAAILISGLAFGHGLLDNAFTNFLISYLKDRWERPYSLRKAAAIVNAYEGGTMFVAIFLDYIAYNQHVGHYKVIICTTSALIMGLVVLWLSTWLLTVSMSSRLFYLALGLLILGIAGKLAAFKPFLYNQFSQKMKMDINEKKVEARGDFWLYIAAFTGAVVSTTLLSSLPWKETFMISAIVMVLVYVFFLYGKSCYDLASPKKNSTLTSRVKQVTQLLKLLPVWTTFLVYSLVEATGSTFFIEQSSNLNDRIGNDFRIPINSFDRIPINSFDLLQSIISFVISQLSDFLIQKLGNEDKQRRARLVRIGLGMFISFLSCIAAWHVEVSRLNLINQSEISDNQNKSTSMSILWLVPQFVFLGLTKGLVGEGLKHFFYDHVEVSMKQLEGPFNLSVRGVGRFLSVIFILVFRHWIGDTINTSRLDEYMRMLAMLNLWTLIVYIFLLNTYEWKIVPPQEESSCVHMEEGGPASFMETKSASIEPSAPLVFVAEYSPQHYLIESHSASWETKLPTDQIPESPTRRLVTKFKSEGLEPETSSFHVRAKSQLLSPRRLIVLKKSSNSLFFHRDAKVAYQRSQSCPTSVPTKLSIRSSIHV
ncbi:hypothetical protein SCA6_009536 [Theobroma cacao]|uniref:Protein NRT1/ PTR FAMILY 5.10 n=2 Tax=Theobroma cacao TaxID=3641 RepID=A0AB32UVN4_THECC|nr:PREDICTED: protein NRT1/ PTR FAMILY 5.10 [Theobroma cacao]EOY16806.1 Uncharacterized protein TCM_035695 [Theobroma cacao]